MTMNYQALIKARKSTRIFRKRKLPRKTLTALTDYFPQAKRLLPELEVEMMLFDSSLQNKLDGPAGYCGFLIAAPHYLLLLSAPSDYALENAGYLGADLLLKLTELEADSCWITLGVSESVLSALELDTDKEPVALLAFGYARTDPDERRLDMKSMSDVTVVDRKRYSAPKISIDDLVKSGGWNQRPDWSRGFAAKAREALYSVTQSPSYLNRQPYRLVLENNAVLLAVQDDEMTHPVDAKLNAGIAMLFFAASYSEKYGNVSWQMGSPPSHCDLPDGWSIVSWCDCAETCQYAPPEKVTLTASGAL